MIKIFYGDDRIRAKAAVEKYLGTDYEVIDGPDIVPADLPSIFFGTSLLTPERKILIRDFTANKAVFDQLPDYLSTPHLVAFLESKLDKRTTTFKSIKDQLEMQEFKLPPAQDFNAIFDIFRVAKRDGKKACAMLSKIKPTEDPIKFTGLLVSQAIKDYEAHPGERERRTLKLLAKTDLEQKSTSLDPWLLVESFLLRLSQ